MSILQFSNDFLNIFDVTLIYNLASLYILPHSTQTQISVRFGKQ